MSQVEEALLNIYDTYMAAMKSGYGPAMDYQGRRLGSFMRANGLTMTDLENLVEKENQ